jgi:hypothetical protein
MLAAGACTGGHGRSYFWSFHVPAARRADYLVKNTSSSTMDTATNSITSTQIAMPSMRGSVIALSCGNISQSLQSVLYDGRLSTVTLHDSLFRLHKKSLAIAAGLAFR